jgi:hypothetical protein
VNEQKNIVAIALFLFLAVITGGLGINAYLVQTRVANLEQEVGVLDNRVTRMNAASSTPRSFPKGPLDQARDAEVYNRLKALEQIVGLRECAKELGTEGKDTSQPDRGSQQK